METLKRDEFRAKIIGDKERFFGSLAEALKAFLTGEVGQLMILGGGICCSFSSRQAEIRRQRPGEFDEFFIQAPVVPLLFCRNIGELPAFTLDIEIEEFIKGTNEGIQIYEQKTRKLGLSDLDLVTNYMVNLDWDENDPRKILLHLHNSDLEEKGFWRADFCSQRNEDGSANLVPIIGSSPYQTINRFSNN